MQPREKFLSRGIDSMSNEELLAVIISKGIKGYNFTSISASVYRKVKRCVSQNLDIFEEIKGIKGIGEVKAMQIVAGIELGKRIHNADNIRKIKILNTEEAWKMLEYMSKYRKEHVIAIFLNARYEVLKKEVIATGSLDRITIHARDIVTPALRLGCAYIILAHNHPSGDSTPSNEDKVFTLSLKSALDIMGIKLLDHLVISSSGWQSVDI